jgi:hypothetical protein
MSLTLEQRRKVNKENASRSTGPRSAEGKSRSRGNALKHGLRAETLPLPNEDPAVAAERACAWNDYYQPESPAAHHLVNACVQATLLHDRCNRHHHALLTKQVREAQEQWDRRHLDEVEALKKRLDDDPAAAVRLLRRSSFGCSWLLECWEQLDVALKTQGEWSPDNLDLAFRLLGICPEEKKEYAAKFDPELLQALMAEQRANLNAERARLWVEFEEADRAEAAERALLPHDPTEARLFLRYYAESRTGFHRAYRDLSRILTEGEPGGFSPDESPENAPEEEAPTPLARVSPNEPTSFSEEAPDPMKPGATGCLQPVRSANQDWLQATSGTRARVSPNEPNEEPAPEEIAPSPAPETAPREENAQETRSETPIEAPAVSPNDASQPRSERSPNEANFVPSALPASGIDRPSEAGTDRFGLAAWPGDIPSALFPSPEGVLI